MSYHYLRNTFTPCLYTGLLKEITVADGAGYYGGASRGKKADGASPLGGSLVSGSGKSLTWAYGGDYNEPVTDGDFCINGLISPDRTVSTAAVLLMVIHISSFKCTQESIHAHAMCYFAL
jgi:Glycosyl hydrolases family 2, TIM barrel domain